MITNINCVLHQNSAAVGARTSTLRRGYDCPESAEYVDSSVYDDRSINIRDAACVFEYRFVSQLLMYFIMIEKIHLNFRIFYNILIKILLL